MIDMKEKVTKTLGGFLNRNRRYTVEIYIRNLSTDKVIGTMYITDEVTFKAEDKKVTLEWEGKRDIVSNNLSFLYDDILACYEEVDEYNQQMVYVALKCGVSFDFECCGLRLG